MNTFLLLLLLAVATSSLARAASLPPSAKPAFPEHLSADRRLEGCDDSKGDLGCAYSSDATVDTCTDIQDTKAGWDAVAGTDDCVEIEFKYVAGGWSYENKVSFTCYESKGWMFEAPGYPYDSTMGMQEGETKIEKLCLKPGDYQLKSWDDFGDGFNGATFEMTVAATGETLTGTKSPAYPEDWQKPSLYFVDLAINATAPCVTHSNCKRCVNDAGGDNECGWCASSASCHLLKDDRSTWDDSGFTCDADDNGNKLMKTNEQCADAAPPEIAAGCDGCWSSDAAFSEGDSLALTTGEKWWESAKIADDALIKVELVKNPQADGTRCVKHDRRRATGGGYGYAECGCEDGTNFCNYDDFDTGDCESCSEFSSIEACWLSGLPEPGAYDCEQRCFGDGNDYPGDGDGSGGGMDFSYYDEWDSAYSYVPPAMSSYNYFDETANDCEELIHTFDNVVQSNFDQVSTDANPNDNAVTFKLPSGLERGDDYALRFSLFSTTTNENRQDDVTGVGNTFSIAPPCFPILLEIDLTNEYYLGEVYWEFENSAATTKFTDTAGNDLVGEVDTVGGSVTTPNTIDMTNINDGQYDNFGVWAGTYWEKGKYTYQACFDPGTYTFTGRDSYGDGWNGGKFSIKDVSSGLFFAKSSGGGTLKNQGVSGSQESFTFQVSGSVELDCLVEWRQNCNSCIVAPSDDDDPNSGCNWCAATNECKFSGTGAGTCPVSTGNEYADDIAGTTPLIMTSTSTCPNPGFSNIKTLKKDGDAWETEVPDPPIFNINQEMKITWDSVAIAAASYIEVQLIYYNCAWMNPDITDGDFPGWELCDDSYIMDGWEEWAYAYETAYVQNTGSTTMTISNAYEGLWAMKVKYYDYDAGQEYSEVSDTFIMQYYYDECTQAQNAGFSNNKFTDAYFDAQMSCYMDQCSDVDESSDFYSTCKDKTDFDGINNNQQGTLAHKTSMNTCICYHEKMKAICPQGVDNCLPNRQEGYELFGTYLNECDKDAPQGMSPYADQYDWCYGDGSEGGQEYSSPSGPTVVKHSTKDPCFEEGSTPTSDCQNFTIVVDLFDWPEESTWELEKSNCFFTMEGPWYEMGHYETTVCLPDGDYTLTGYDSAMDGWNMGGYMSILDQDGAFKLIPTEVAGMKTEKVFSVSSAACQHETCGACVAEAACGYCIEDPTRSVCYDMVNSPNYCANADTSQTITDTTQSGRDAFLPASMCENSAYLPTISLDSLDDKVYSSASDTVGVYYGGSSNMTVTWVTQNIGAAIAVQLKLTTTSYVCTVYDGDDCSSNKEFIVAAGTPNDLSFEYDVSPYIPSGEDYMLVATINVDDTTSVTDTAGPFKIVQPCVDVVIQVDTGNWAAEMEWELWDGIGTEPLIKAASAPELVADNDPDVFKDGKTTEHFRKANSEYTTQADTGLDFDADLCLLPGTYELHAIDTFGDGWNGGGTIRAKTAENGAVFAGPVNPEGLSSILLLDVSPVEATDADVSQCPFIESCGACSAYSGENCGWCINSGKCSSTGGSCTGIYISGDIQCPNNIQVVDLEDTYYEVGEDITVKWSGTGFTSDSSTLVALFKGDPESCTDDQLSYYGNFTQCEHVDWQYDLAPGQEMNAGLGDGIVKTLDWPRFTNDDDYFIAIISNVEDGVFGYGNQFEVFDPNTGMCSGSRTYKITHTSVVDAGENNGVTALEAFLTDGSAGESYNNNMACEFSITAPDGYNVYLSFLDVSLETGCGDLLTIRDGNSTADPVRAFVCAPYYPNAPDVESVMAPSIKSLNNKMHVQWASDQTLVGGGWEAVAIAVKAPEATGGGGEGGDGSTTDEEVDEEVRLPSCGNGPPNSDGIVVTTYEMGPADSNMGIIGSGFEGDENVYQNKMKCVWKFTARAGYRLEFVFTAFDLEPNRDVCGYDSLTIEDDGHSDTKKIYCGATLRPTYQSISNKVTVTFQSDDTVALSGFKIKFSAKENVMTTLPSRLLQIAGSRSADSELPANMRRLIGGDDDDGACNESDGCAGCTVDGDGNALKDPSTLCTWIEDEDFDTCQLTDRSGHCEAAQHDDDDDDDDDDGIEVVGTNYEIPDYCEAKVTMTLSSSGNLKGTISDGTAAAYGKNTACKWVINMDDAVGEDYGIKLDFESFHVEGGEEPVPCEYDYVTVSNGNGNLLGKICGRKNLEDGYIYSTCSETENCKWNKFTGPSTSTFYTKTKQLVVEFHTDSSVQLAGFVANFKALPNDQIADETRNWAYTPWGECQPIRFGFNDGERQRDVQCGFDDANTQLCPESGLFPSTSSSKWSDDSALNYDAGIKPTSIYKCMVEGSSLRWSGEYFIENTGCDMENYCCFHGLFQVTQKNSDQKNAIHITELVGETSSTNNKCRPMEGDSVDYGTGEDIFFPLAGDGDTASNAGTFIVYGVHYNALKSGGYMEFMGTDQGISLGHCEDGDCVPKEMDWVIILIMVAIETGVIVVLLLLWFIYKSVNTGKAKNNALRAAEAAQGTASDLNDIIEKKMERQRKQQEDARKATMNRHTMERASSMDNMEILEGEDFDNFEGVDLCGMQKLTKIDTRDPTDRKIVQAFNKADTDGSGFIDVDELLRAMVETTGKPWTKTQIQEIFDEFDEDKSGELGVEEFKLLVNSTIGGSLNTNRNKYTDEDFNKEWFKPSREEAEKFAVAHLSKCPEGMGEELWAKEFFVTRILFGDSKKELRPVWSTDIDDCDFGVGISLYFKNTMFLSYMLFGAFLISLPIIVSNSMQQSSSLNVQLRGSYVSSESLNIMAGVTDLVICSLLALVLTLADEKEKGIISKIDEGVQTPADYTLVMKNAPPVNEISIGQWRKYFEDITKDMERVVEDYVDVDQYLVKEMIEKDGPTEDGKVVSISYCVKGARTIYDMVKKRRDLEDRLYFKVRALKKKDPDYKLPHASHNDPPTFFQKILRPGTISPEYMLTMLDDLDKKINDLQMSDKPKMGSRMFVTFDTELALDTACIKSFEVPGPTGKCPKVKQSCEASDLIYSNMAVGIWNRRIREILGYLLCFTFIIGSLVFLVWVNSMRYDPRIAGYAVAVINAFLKVFCEFWCKKVELPLTYSDQQYSLMTKLTAARVFNTAILLLFTCEQAERGTGLWGLPKFLYLNTEFVSKVQSTIFADITLSLGKIVDAPLVAKRVFLSRLVVPATQTQYNNMFAPRPWNLAERYSDCIKTIFTCLLYISVLPTGLGYAAFAFGLAYFSDKYCILRTWERPPEFDYKMSVTARYILEWTLVAHLAMTLYLYTQWPFVEIETDMEKVYTPHQKLLVFVYTAATFGAAVFFGAKQFGNMIVASVTNSIGEQRCSQSFIVRMCKCLRPPEQKFHIERYSQLPGYGLASYNPHPEGESAADFESFHVINTMAEPGVREKIMAPKIVAFMAKTKPTEGTSSNQKEEIGVDKKFTVLPNKPEQKYAAVAKKDEESECESESESESEAQNEVQAVEMVDVSKDIVAKTDDGLQATL